MYIAMYNLYIVSVDDLVLAQGLVWSIRNDFIAKVSCVPILYIMCSYTLEKTLNLETIARSGSLFCPRVKVTWEKPDLLSNMSFTICSLYCISYVILCRLCSLYCISYVIHYCAVLVPYIVFHIIIICILLVSCSIVSCEQAFMLQVCDE